jgi:hypothetical protein
MVELSEGKLVTLKHEDLDWLSRIHMLLPELPLRDER